MVLLYSEAATKAGKVLFQQTLIEIHANLARHTHSQCYSNVLHPNAPSGTLVVPQSSICKTIQGPREKEATWAGICTAFRCDRRTGGKKRKEEKHNLNQTKIQDRITRRFSRKYLRRWHYIPSHIRLTDRYIFCKDIHNETQQCFYSTGENCFRVTGERR